MVFCIVVCSLGVQLVALFYAVSLARGTGRVAIGACFAGALSLMAVRRLMGLSEVLVAPSEGHLGYELAGLAASGLMLAGILAVRRHLLLARSVEQSLREHERVYRAVADAADGWECWRAADGKPLYVSPACEEITGYGPSFFYQDPAFVSRIVHPSDVGATGPQCCCRTECPEMDVFSRYRIIRRDGEVRWVSSRCRPVYGADGAVTGWRGSIRDVTEHVLDESRQALLVSELQETLSRVRTLSGMLTMCASCKKIREDGGEWTRLETYLHAHTNAQFSHGLCSDCVRQLYPEEAPEIERKLGRLNSERS